MKGRATYGCIHCKANAGNDNYNSHNDDHDHADYDGFNNSTTF